MYQTDNVQHETRQASFITSKVNESCSTLASKVTTVHMLPFFMSIKTFEHKSMDEYVELMLLK